jgi:hypothetical protein
LGTVAVRAAPSSTVQRHCRVPVEALSYTGCFAEP